MVLKSTLLLSLAVVQMALASTVTIVSPKAKEVWHAGQVVEFKWTGDASTNTTGKANSKQKVNHDGKLSIALATGPAQSLVIDRVIASNVNVAKGSYKWKIPKNINTSKKYVIEIGPNASDIAFAGYVTILKAQPSNSTNSTSAKPTKSSATVKPTHTVITTTTPTKKHEPTAVCVSVPNKNGGGATIKCHPKPSSSKKSSSAAKKSSSTTKKSSSSKNTKAASHPKPSSSTSKSYQHHATTKVPHVSDPTPSI